MMIVLCSTLRSLMAPTFHFGKNRFTMSWCKRSRVNPIKLKGVKPESCGCSLKDIECYHYGKNEHLKRDCHTYKQEKGKEKEKEEKPKSLVKIEERNVVSEDEGDILLNLGLDAAHMV